MKQTAKRVKILLTIKKIKNKMKKKYENKRKTIENFLDAEQIEAIEKNEEIETNETNETIETIETIETSDTVPNDPELGNVDGLGIEEHNPVGIPTDVVKPKRKYNKKPKNAESNDNKSADYDVFNDLEAFSQNTKTAQTPEKPSIITKGKKSKNDVLITGYMLLIFCDLAIPTVICLVYKMSRGGNVKATDLQLDKEQIDSLLPIADQAAKELALHINPLWLLLGTLSGMYMSKLYMLSQK